MISYLFISVLQSMGACLKLQTGDQKKSNFGTDVFFVLL
jgi:hypothetical protein